MIARRGALVLALVFLAATAHAQQGKGKGREALSATIDGIVNARLSEWQSPAIAVAVIRGGNVVHKKGYGEKVRGNGDTPDENTVFYIGSMSKALTAFGAMVLVDEGKLALDAPVSRYLRDWPAQWSDVTVRHLMAHTSGIPQLDPKAREVSFRETLVNLAAKPREFKPAGSDQSYNNFNYSTVGQLIEASSGKPYLDFMRERVFGPLGMTSTGHPAIGSNKAAAHDDGKPTGAEPLPHKGNEYGVPSGFLASNLNDLIKFERAIAEGKLIGPKTRAEFLKPVAVKGDPNTPGWHTRTLNGARVLYKPGMTQGYEANLAFLPDRNFNAVIVLCNDRGKRVHIVKLTNEIMQASFPGAFGK